MSMDRLTGEWLCNNFAAGGLHTEILCSKLYSIKVEFYLKNKNSLSELPFGGLGAGGNVRTPSIARWKAVVDFVFVIIELFCYLLRLRRYKRKSDEIDMFRMGGSL